MNAIEDIKSFVEGRISAKSLYEKVVSNSEYEKIFEEFSAKPYTNDGSLYLYIIGQNYKNPATTVNLQDALAKFLEWKGVSYHQDKSALQVYEIILKSSPAWVSLPEFYIDKVKNLISDVDEKKAHAVVKMEIKKDFVSLGKPPKWLQSPDWPFDGQNPMVFVGQLGLDNLKHDISYIYIFINPKNDKVCSIIQTA